MINKKSLANKQAKPRYSLLPWDALEGVVRVMEKGALKHSKDSWKDYPNALEMYKDAAQRHMAAIMRGEIRDKETGELHADHLTCCALIISWHESHCVPIAIEVEPPKKKRKKKSSILTKNPDSPIGFSWSNRLTNEENENA